MDITRDKIKIGLKVDISLKGNLDKIINGKVKEILTKVQSHPHGIMVRLEDGNIGRVKKIGGNSNDSVKEKTKIKDLIKKGEKFNIEFKSSALWSLHYSNQQKHLSQRFELYYRGIELGNGFHELADVEEQKKRFDAENQRRQQMGKAVLPIDDRFLKALEHGLPNCAGIAMGFDRILMLAAEKTKIDEVISFSWNRS